MKPVVPRQGVGTSAYVDEYWDNLTDAELLAVPWYIDDPRTLPNVQETIPSDLGEFQIEIEYERDRADAPVRCAHCPQHTPHWHGFVLKEASGRRFLLGSSCGPKAYGAHYRVASNARNRQKRRYSALTDWLSIRSALPDIVEALAELDNAPGLKAFRRARARLHRFAPKLASRLVQISPDWVSQKRHLQIAYSERDEADERLRQEAFDAAVLAIVDLPNKQHRIEMEALKQRYRPGQPTIIQQERNLGPLPPLDWLFRSDAPEQMVPDVAARLSRACHLAALLAAFTADVENHAAG